MRLCFAVLSLVGIACSATAADKMVPVTLTPAQHSAVEAAVRAQFQDPDNAEFSKVSAAKPAAGDGKLYTVCGLVKRKLADGTSWNPPFIGRLDVAGEKFELTGKVDERDYASHRMTYRSCAEHGISLM